MALIKEVGITKYKELRKIINKAVMGYIHADHYNHPLPITYIDQTLKELEPLLCEGKKVGDVVGVERIKVVIDRALADSIEWRHIDFPDDFPYDRIMTIIMYQLAKAISNLPLREGE